MTPQKASSKKCINALVIDNYKTALLGDQCLPECCQKLTLHYTAEMNTSHERYKLYAKVLATFLFTRTMESSYIILSHEEVIFINTYRSSLLYNK